MSDIRPLRSAADHAAALEEVVALVGATPGSAQADRLAVLAVLIADYERRASTDAASPLDTVKLDMELHGRSQAELASVLGSRSRASEVLAGRRALTASMADRLAKAWNIPRTLLGPPSSGARRSARAVGVAAILFAATMSAGGGYYAWATHDLPSIAPIVDASAAPHAVTLDDIPLHVRQAFLAAEDSSFYTHGGASARGIVRASADNIGHALSGRRPSGGSTITQQLLKNTVLHGEPRSLRRKLRELALAGRLEAALPKDRILELYLNEIYFGGDVTGIAAASQHYFGVPVRDLSVPQAAMLAALPSAPNRFRIDVAANLPRAQTRRDWVLTRMSDEGYLTMAALSEAQAAPLR